MFAATTSTLYGLSPNKTAVFQWTGQGDRWQQIGGPASMIITGGDSLYATNPQTGDIYKYNGIPNSWIRVGGYVVATPAPIISPGPSHSYIVRMESIPIVAKMSEALGFGRDTVYASISAKSSTSPPFEGTQYMGNLDSGHTHPCVSDQIVRCKYAIRLYCRQHLYKSVLDRI